MRFTVTPSLRAQRWARRTMTSSRWKGTLAPRRGGKTSAQWLIMASGLCTSPRSRSHFSWLTFVAPSGVSWTNENPSRYHGTVPSASFSVNTTTRRLRRTRLADGVTEPDIPLARRVAGAEASREPLGGLQHLGREALGDAVAAAALRHEVRAHVAIRVAHAPVRVDQKQADPVLQLPLDGAPLVGDEPPAAVRGGERVVRPGEHGLVETNVAESEGAVALPSVGNPIGGARIGAAARDHQHQRHGRPQHDHTGGAGAGEGARAYPLALDLRLTGPLEQNEQLGGAEEDEQRAAGDREQLDRERRVEPHEDADAERRHAPRGPPQ